jgi:hypothetical protein
MVSISWRIRAWRGLLFGSAGRFATRLLEDLSHNPPGKPIDESRH